MAIENHNLNKPSISIRAIFHIYIYVSLPEAIPCRLPPKHPSDFSASHLGHLAIEEGRQVDRSTSDILGAKNKRDMVENP